MEKKFELFFSSKKHEIWWKIFKEIIVFLSKENFIDSENFKKISEYFEISKYEIFSMNKADGDVFDSFVKTIMSKSVCFKNEWIVNSLRKITFENNYCSLFLKQSNDYLLENFKKIHELLKDLAIKHKYLIQVGRTHGVHAEPISFGYKFALCYLDLERKLENFKKLRKDIEISWVDMFSFHDIKTSIQLQKHISNVFALFLQKSSDLDLPYNKYGIYLSQINSIVLDIFKLTLDLCFFDSDEIKEIKESNFKNSFLKIEKLHKKISQETNAYFDFLNQYSKGFIFLENSGWLCLENIVKNFILFLQEFYKVLKHVSPNEEYLTKNLNLSKSRIFSQSAMTHIIKSGNFSRQKILKDMKYFSAKSLNINEDFRSILLSDSQYKQFFSKKDETKIFSFKEFLKNIDALYLKIFQNENNNLEKYIKVSNLFDQLDLLSDRLNFEYKNEISPVVFVSFEENSMIFLGLLFEKLYFPVKLVIFSNLKNNLNIESLKFDHDLFIAKKILIVDLGLEQEFDLAGFCEKLKTSVFVKELKKCKDFLN